MSIITSTHGPVFVVQIDRPKARNAVDRATAAALADAFRGFDADDALSVAVLTGTQGSFCAGADLKAVATGGGNRASVSACSMCKAWPAWAKASARPSRRTVSPSP